MILVIQVLTCFAIVKTEAQEQVIRKFTEDLKSNDPQVRQSAIESLVELGEPAVPALIGVLKHEDVGVLSAAARALGQIGTPEAIKAAEGVVPAMIQLMQDKNQGWSVRVADALGNMGEGAVDAVPALIQALQDENPDISHAAAGALGNIGGFGKEI